MSTAHPPKTATILDGPAKTPVGTKYDANMQECYKILAAEQTEDEVQRTHNALNNSNYYPLKVPSQKAKIPEWVTS